jgi:hypothetical protein
MAGDQLRILAQSWGLGRLIHFAPHNADGSWSASLQASPEINFGAHSPRTLKRTENAFQTVFNLF